MKKLNNMFACKYLACALVLLTSLWFTACENPIIETWWKERGPEPEPDYHIVIKQLPPEIKYIFIEVIHTVVSTLPPDKEVILQNLTVIDIEYIIFAGNSVEYNGPPGIAGGTALTAAQINTNNAYLDSMAQTLAANPDFLVIIHGHANPTEPGPGEPGHDPDAFAADLEDCKRIAKERADAVAERFKLKGIADDRIKTNGFGGTRTIGDPSHPELNRRVEIIIISVEWRDAVPSPRAAFSKEVFSKEAFSEGAPSLKERLL